MQTLILFFVELCLLRRKPQDLPASDILLGLTISAYLVGDLLLGAMIDIPPASNLFQGVVEIAITLGALRIALQLTGHLGRFTQAASALMGSGAVIGFAEVIPLAMNAAGSEETDAATLGALLLLAMFGWSLAVIGHILRHTFTITLGQGTAIAFAFEMFMFVLLRGFFGGG